MLCLMANFLKYLWINSWPRAQIVLQSLLKHQEEVLNCLLTPFINNIGPGALNAGNLVPINCLNELLKKSSQHLPINRAVVDHLEIGILENIVSEFESLDLELSSNLTKLHVWKISVLPLFDAGPNQGEAVSLLEQGLDNPSDFVLLFLGFFEPEGLIFPK